MKKRLMSLLLVIALLLSVLPLTAFADTGNAEDCAGNLGTDASYTGEAVRLSSALYTFTGSSGNWTIESASNPGVYLHHIASDYAGYPGASTSIAYTLETGSESGSFYLRSVSKDGYGYSYLYFWRNGNNYFDRVTNVDNSACSFRIYKPVSEGETQSSEIPGYVQVTSESAIVSGGQYLIVAAYNGSYYALYPSTSTDSKYAHVVKVNAAAELPAAPQTPSEPDVPDEDLTSDVSGNNWTITVEKYDADGNGTYLLEPTVVNYDFFENWVPGILNYYWGNNYSKVEYDSHRNEYYITQIADATQEDGWLDNGDLGENSHWKIVWNGTVLADKPSGCYASRGAVIRYIFSVDGDAAEAGVDKNGLIQYLADLTGAGKTAAGNAYDNAKAVVLNPNATAEDVTNAINALDAALYPAATGISLSPQSLEDLGVGKSVTVTATLTPATSRDTVTWSTADETIATVDENGTVTGVTLGSTTLTAKVSDTVSSTIPVTVNRVEATGITLANAQVEVGKSVQLTATLEPCNTTDTVTWSIENESIATVDQNGVATGITIGVTTVTATVNGYTDTATLTVTENRDPYVYFEYTDGRENQYMADDGSFTLSSLDEGYFRVANTDATAWWENEEVIDAGQGSVTYHWYVNRETGAWQPSGQQPTKSIVVSAGGFTQSFTINYKQTSGVEQLRTYVIEDGQPKYLDVGENPYDVTGCVWYVPVYTEGLVDGEWVDIPVQALSYDTSDNVYYNFRFVGNELLIDRAGSATMTVSLKGENVSTSFKAVCNPVLATAMQVVVPETAEIGDWDAVTNQYVGLRPFTGFDIEFTPANATNRDVTWTALTPDIAEYSSLHSAGIVPKKAGTAEFIVTNTADPSLTQKVTVTFVYKNPLTAASAEEAYYMTAGAAADLTINFNPSNATEQRFIWTYSQDGIVTVTDRIKMDETGTISWTTHQIEALKEGFVTVTGTPYDQTGGAQPITFTVTVGEGIPEEPADIDKIVSEGIADSKSVLQSAYANHVFEYGDEWAVFMLTRTGNHLTEAQIAHYLETVVSAYTDPTAAERKPTTIARVILGVSVLGQDAADLEGIDLVALLCGSDQITSGSNEAAWALIALDSRDYAIPEGAEWTREKLIEAVLSYQNPVSGGFGFSDNMTYVDPDLTAMCLQGLAPYYAANEAVKNAVNAALAYLQDQMDRNCDFGSSETISQVLIALTALELDPLDEANGFVKSAARNLLTALDAYHVYGSGFKHVLSSDNIDNLASLQALQALAAYDRYRSGNSALYDLTNVSKADEPSQPEASTPETGSTESGNSSPKTGDHYLVLPMVGLAISLFGLAAMTAIRKKKDSAQ